MLLFQTDQSQLWTLDNLYQPTTILRRRVAIETKMREEPSFVHTECDVKDEVPLGAVLGKDTTADSSSSCRDECVEDEIAGDGKAPTALTARKEKTVANEETDVPSLPATNADKIKGLSKVLESGLRDVLALVEDDYPLSTALETTVDTFEEHLAEVARCISPEFSTAEKPSRNSSKAVSDDISGDFENVLPTVGQKRRLVSLHGACLTVIFRLLAEHLLRNENTLEAQIPDIQDVAAGLTLVVKAFDANWERLKLDHRVAEKPEIPKKVITERPNNPKEGPPDMWCAIAQARALLALALARAALITSDKDAVGSVIDELVGGGLATVSKTGHRHTAATLGVARAKEHLAEAKSLANWTWWNRKLCSKKAKEAVVHWQDWFWPIYGMIEDGIAYARSERSEFGEDVLLEPVFVGPVQVKVRWDYQFTDVSVGYGYDSC